MKYENYRENPSRWPIRCKPNFMISMALIVMLRHAIVGFAVAAFFDGFKVASELQLRGIKSLIENVHRNEANFNNERDDRSQDVDENMDGYSVLSGRELDALINQVAHDVYSRNENKNLDLTTKLNTHQHDKTEYVLDEYLQQLLSPNSQKSAKKSIDKKQSIDHEDMKTYVIISPHANLKEKDFSDISNLLKQILAGSTGEKIYPIRNRSPFKEEHRYKGFVISGSRPARRRNRESRERYSPQDSMEDYKPKKKLRSDYGGAGGRTPIPFIRHRDIYERD